MKTPTAQSPTPAPAAPVQRWTEADSVAFYGIKKTKRRPSILKNWLWSETVAKVKGGAK